MVERTLSGGSVEFIELLNEPHTEWERKRVYGVCTHHFYENDF